MTPARPRSLATFSTNCRSEASGHPGIATAGTVLKMSAYPMIRIPILLSSLLFAGSLFADSAQVDIAAFVQNPLTTTMAVVNRGPDVARNSVITIDIPPGLVLQRLSGTEGDCDLTRRPVRCSLGDLAVIDLPAVYPHYMGTEFTAPFADATYVVTFTVSSDTPDPNPSTNTASVTFTTKLEADLGVLIAIPP